MPLEVRTRRCAISTLQALGKTVIARSIAICMHLITDTLGSLFCNVLILILIVQVGAPGQVITPFQLATDHHNPLDSFPIFITCLSVVKQ